MNHLAFSVVTLAVASTLSAQVSLVHLGTVDVASTSSAANPEYIGSNPSAVAWNGTDVWVAGYNSSGTTGDAAIVKVSNALTNPTYGARFGVQSATPNQRGYSGLDVSGNLVAAAYDQGSVAPGGITGWDLAGNSLWAKDARGSCGVGIDPGFAGIDAGTGWTSFGSGRRSLQDNATGADIYTSSNGMVILTPGSGTLWRDMDFGSLLGNVYLRRSNQVHRCERIGGNTCTNQQQISNAITADFVNIQNLAYVRQGVDEIIFWNDRNNTFPGQQFDVVVQAMDPAGGALSIDWGGFTAPGSSGAFDFSYDEASRTLAICDFNNRAVYVFSVAVFQSYGAGCAGQGGFVPTLVGRGDTRPSGSLDYEATNLAPVSIGLFAFGNFTTNVPLPFPNNCPLLIDPLIGTYGVFVTAPGTPGSGTGSYSLPLPSSAVSGVPITTQCIVLENASLSSVVTSNGITVTLP